MKSLKTKSIMGLTVFFFLLGLSANGVVAKWVSKKTRENIEVQKTETVTEEPQVQEAKPAPVKVAAPKKAQAPVKAAEPAPEPQKQEEQVAEQAAGQEANVVEAKVEEEQSGKIEDQLLDDMLSGESFPEKTAYIQKEDSKEVVAETPVIPKVKANKPEQVAGPMDGFKDMMMSTALLGGVVIFLGFLYKKISQKASGIKSSEAKSLKVVAQQAVGPKSKILIVEAKGKTFLVGQTESQIQLLSDLDFYEAASAVEEDLNANFEEQMPKAPVARQAEAAEEFEQTEEAPVITVNFSDRPVENRASGLAKNVADQAVAPEGPAPAVQRIQERLKGMKQL
ncbi:MAG: flagellar biosynthetic protein FliO [Deltaproteobacteria bacterium]|nr:flagellar biosynthetic protein FliO [Deltaproteobacteria bacterium]